MTCNTFKLAVILAALQPMVTVAAPKVDLSNLGKKAPQVQQVDTQSDLIEEEVISTRVYTSGQSDIGMRRNVELVRPTTAQLQLKKPKVVKENKSAFEFVDKALGIKPVKSWEKGTLAKKEMKPGGPVPEFDLFSEKVFAYKQGSVGGSGVGGGGCGCN
ncbi:DUF4266 domain-containing protein [Vibrio tubiashii]|uniref:DUF4266 domain-containing protein n=1 Tax=Vibrio tubiashii TaxID=29498 RepID=A0AAE5GM03_9VIBR|nr:DUF4266 domain-containing protein [Vibrio tubiashii]NOI79326.1 DUF4266 domain-containing protein [Vibrio tubiashii]